MASIVAKAPLPALVDLVFDYYAGGAGDAIAEILIRSHRGLRKLGLTWVEITDEGVATIANSKWPNLEWLVFGSGTEGHTALGEEAILALMRTTAPLKRLELNDVQLNSEDARLLAKGTWTLEHLSLRCNDLEDLADLWNAPCLRSLVGLDLHANDLDDAQLVALAKLLSSRSFVRSTSGTTSFAKQGSRRSWRLRSLRRSRSTSAGRSRAKIPPLSRDFAAVFRD